MEAGWGCLAMKWLINVCKWCSRNVPVCVVLWCIPSFLICCSIATILSFFLLRILALTFCLARLALAPLAKSSSWAVRAVFTASVQYFCVLVWNLERLVKLISRRKRLALGTCSEAKFDKVSFPAWFLWHSLYGDTHVVCPEEKYVDRSTGSVWFEAALRWTAWSSPLHWGSYLTLWGGRTVSHRSVLICTLWWNLSILLGLCYLQVP